MQKTHELNPKKKKVLIIYSTTNGHCLKVSDFIKQYLNANVDVISIKETIPNLNFYDGIIIGASIRYGKHNSLVKKYINSHYKEIQSKPNAFFSISLIARKEERRTIECNPYVKKFLSSIKWKPQKLSIIGGVLNYPEYSILDKYMIKFIMNITHGPTDLSSVIEYTNWNDVKKFALDFNQGL